MQEDFLHYIWEHKKLNTLQLKTTQHEPLEIVSGGILNFHSGPDFFNGKLRIGDQLWAGNIEIHIKSSDWFVHNHELDPAYDNVILHVVYEHDTEIFRNDNSIIPTLELKSYIDADVLKSYNALIYKADKWINCDSDFSKTSDFIMNNWLERLYFERLERKSNAIELLLEASKNDWEAVLFQLLAKNFGLKVNGDSFFSMANSIDFSVIRKTQSKTESLEALFFGQLGVLQLDISNAYYLKLQSEYAFLKQKFDINSQGIIPLRFFRLRPLNFPTIRLSQLSNLYHKEKQLFSRIIELEELSELYELFSITTSKFWETHYTFKKESKHLEKKLSKSFIDLVLINTIVPLKFCYAKRKGKPIDETIVKIISAITSEKNNIIEGFETLQYVSESAMVSQGLIQLKTEYCNKNKCLKCAIGNSILNK